MAKRICLNLNASIIVIIATFLIYLFYFILFILFRFILFFFFFSNDVITEFRNVSVFIDVYHLLSVLS